MKTLNITYVGTTTTVRSEAAMWNALRAIRDGLNAQAENTARAIVTTEDGTAFKEIVFRTNSKGKIEMVNLVKETCRRQVEKAKAEAAAKAAKEAERRARKREADRRYRAKKHAAKIAAQTAAAQVA